MQLDQVGGRPLALQSPVQARARSPPARQMPDSAQTAASTMAQMSKRACHQPPETNGSRPAATPPRRSPRPRLIDQPLSTPKSAADPHVAPSAIATFLPVVLRRPVDSAQYTSVAFGKRCGEAGVRPSMGSVGDAYDNAMAESFFSTLEAELLSRRWFASQAEAKMACFSYIEGWYNPVRLHSGLGYRSPITYEADMQAAMTKT